jgi:glycogen operon protein
VLDLRDRMRRNALATLLVSHGTPMLLMGDEIGRTQGGNNNAYAQDNETSWLAWEGIGARDAEFFRFARALIRLRREFGLLTPARFMHGQPVDESRLKNALWLRPDGAEMTPGDWSDSRARVVGLALASAEGERLLLLFNAYDRPVAFTLPRMSRTARWRLRLDTARGLVEPQEEPVGTGAGVTLPERALLFYQGMAE